LTLCLGSAADQWELVKHENLHFEVKHETVLTATDNVIVCAEFGNLFEMTGITNIIRKNNRQKKHYIRLFSLKNMNTRQIDNIFRSDPNTQSVFHGAFTRDKPPQRIG